MSLNLVHSKDILEITALRVFMENPISYLLGNHGEKYTTSISWVRYSKASIFCPQFYHSLLYTLAKQTQEVIISVILLSHNPTLLPLSAPPTRSFLKGTTRFL